MRGLTEIEATDLVRLPETTIPNTSAALSPENQQLALAWGGRDPYLLQLAGLYLWEAQTQHHSQDWARVKFNEQAKRLERSLFDLRRWKRWLGVLAWLPLNLGRMAITIGSKLGNIGSSITGALDEFERLSEIVAATNSRVPLNFLRYVMQNRSQWILLFSGSHTLDELEPYWSDYLINTRSLRVTYLEETAARELILEPVAGFPEIYQPETVNCILDWTRCQPFLVQLMCSELVDYLNRNTKGDARKTKATPQDVEAVIPKMFETGGMYFRELWRLSLTEEQRQTIERLVIRETLTSTDKVVCRKLVHKEILKPTESGNYSFQVPLVQRYIKQVLREEV